MTNATSTISTNSNSSKSFVSIIMQAINVYRRVDETEMFFHGDYEANYGNYKYPIKFECYYDPSFHT